MQAIMIMLYILIMGSGSGIEVEFYDALDGRTTYHFSEETVISVVVNGDTVFSNPDAGFEYGMCIFDSEQTAFVVGITPDSEMDSTGFVSGDVEDTSKDTKPDGFNIAMSIFLTVVFVGLSVWWAIDTRGRRDE